MLKALKNLPLLRSIDEERWKKLEPYISFKQLVPEETLFECGSKSKNLYVVLEGKLELYLPATGARREALIKQRQHGETAGDFAVLNGGEHIVTSRAATYTTVACFPTAGFEKLSNLHPNIIAHVYETAAELSRSVLLVKSFLSLFEGITDVSLQGLLKDTTIKHLRSGEELFRQGDDTDGLYIVMAGRLPIRITRDDGVSTVIAEASAPQLVGEFSLITGAKRSATVYASRESMVAYLDKKQFHQHIMRKPSLLASVSRMIIQRQNSINQQRITGGHGHHIAIVPLSNKIPLRRFIHMLKQELRKSEKTLAIDSHQFDTLYGRRGAAQTTFSDTFNTSVTAWLDDRESRYGHVLYVADHEWDAWTHRCLNRADRILLLADTTEAPDQKTIEKKLNAMFEPREHQPRVEYALLHPPDTVAPKNTQRWLNNRKMTAYHHIRLEDQSHYGRLARRLTSTAYGLILSGGGARGYVHLGVHKAIEEKGITIDYIGGTSMGGLLGGAMAMGLSSTQIVGLSDKFANPKALFDYTLPISALMKSAKLTTFCKELYQDKRIEDLWIPYFCMSSNLSQGTEKCHQTGLLWKAVRASIAIPGLFSPVPQKNGELLVDGAVLNTFPVIQMEKLLYGGTLIGVNVSQVEAMEHNYNYGTSISGWVILGNKLNPFRKHKLAIPRIMETLLRSNDIKSIEELGKTRKLLDLLIEPEVYSYTLLDFRSYAKISEIGYRATLTALSETSLCFDTKTCNPKDNT